jgi:hypothetical protein
MLDKLQAFNQQILSLAGERGTAKTLEEILKLDENSESSLVLQFWNSLASIANQMESLSHTSGQIGEWIEEGKLDLVLESISVSQESREAYLRYLLLLFYFSLQNSSEQNKRYITKVLSEWEKGNSEQFQKLTPDLYLSPKLISTILFRFWIYGISLKKFVRGISSTNLREIISEFFLQESILAVFSPKKISLLLKSFLRRQDTTICTLVYYEIGNLYLRAGLQKESVLFYNKAIQKGRKTNFKEGFIYLKIVYECPDLERKKKFLHTIFKNYPFSEDENTTLDLIDPLLANLKIHQGDPAFVLQNLEILSSQLDSIKDPNTVSFILSRIGNLTFELDERELSNKVNDKLETVIQKNRNPFYRSNLYSTLSYNKCLQTNKNLSLEFLVRAKNDLKKCKTSYHKVVSALHLAEAYLQLQNSFRFLYFIQKAKSFLSASKKTEAEKIFLDLFPLLKSLNNFDLLSLFLEKISKPYFWEENSLDSWREVTYNFDSLLSSQGDGSFHSQYESALLTWKQNNVIQKMEWNQILFWKDISKPDSLFSFLVKRLKKTNDLDHEIELLVQYWIFPPEEKRKTTQAYLWKRILKILRSEPSIPKKIKGYEVFLHVPCSEIRKQEIGSFLAKEILSSKQYVFSLDDAEAIQSYYNILFHLYLNYKIYDVKQFFYELPLSFLQFQISSFRWEIFKDLSQDWEKHGQLEKAKSLLELAVSLRENEEFPNLNFPSFVLFSSSMERILDPLDFQRIALDALSNLPKKKNSEYQNFIFSLLEKFLFWKNGDFLLPFFRELVSQYPQERTSETGILLALGLAKCGELESSKMLLKNEIYEADEYESQFFVPYLLEYLPLLESTTYQDWVLGMLLENPNPSEWYDPSLKYKVYPEICKFLSRVRDPQWMETHSSMLYLETGNMQTVDRILFLFSLAALQKNDSSSKNSFLKEGLNLLSQPKIPSNEVIDLLMDLEKWVDPDIYHQIFEKYEEIYWVRIQKENPLIEELLFFAKGIFRLDKMERGNQYLDMVLDLLKKESDGVKYALHSKKIFELILLYRNLEDSSLFLREFLSSIQNFQKYQIRKSMLEDVTSLLIQKDNLELYNILEEYIFHTPDQTEVKIGYRSSFLKELPNAGNLQFFPSFFLRSYLLFPPKVEDSLRGWHSFVKALISRGFLPQAEKLQPALFLSPPFDIL